VELLEQDIKKLLQDSLTSAQAKPDRGKSLQEINQNRSRSWVNTLAEQLKIVYEAEPDVTVFSKYDRSHRKDFRLNELLYDIVVCRVDEVASSTHKKKLCYIKETLWQVESEFAHDSRQALIDFNKLVLGSARNKLFIGPQVRKGGEHSFLNVLKPAALACTGSVYIALVPHPAKWKDTNSTVRLWSMKT